MFLISGTGRPYLFIFLFFAIFGPLNGYCPAEILNYADKDTDEFIHLGYRFTNAGMIYCTLTDGVAAVEATFTSDRPPEEIIKVYDGYLEDKGSSGRVRSMSDAMRELQKNPDIIKRIASGEDRKMSGRLKEMASLFKESGEPRIPVWAWSGKIDNGEKLLYIRGTSGKTCMIKAVSRRKGRSILEGFDIISDECPEFSELSGRPILSRQVITTGGCSALFIYDSWGAPGQALERAVKRLTRSGWVVQMQSPNTGSESAVATMIKKNIKAFLSVSRDMENTGLIASVDLKKM
jgi:hypothetical protein